MTTPGTPPTARVLPAVSKLLLLQLRMTYNGFRHARTRNKVGSILLGLLLLAFAGFLLWMSWSLLEFLRSPEISAAAGQDPQAMLDSIPVLMLSGLFAGILLTSFGVLLQGLYLSGDMDFLLAAPLPIRAVFTTKLLQAVLPNFGLSALFGLPVLFGLGMSAGYHLVYYPLVVIMMAALALAAAGLSSLLVMLVVRVLPPRRAAEILGFLGGTIGLICSQTGNLSSSFGEEFNAAAPQFTGMITQLNTAWLPLNWAGQGLIALGNGRWAAGILLTGLTLGLAAFTFGVALATAERWYYSGWAGMQVVARRKKGPQPSASRTRQARTGAARLLPLPVWAVLHKDFLIMRRDLRNMSQLISPLILGIIYTLAIFRGGGEPPAGRGEAPEWFMNGLDVIMAYSGIGMALFVGWMLLGRLAGMSFSLEGKNFWMLRTAPIRPGQLLAAKFLVAYLPAVTLGLLFVSALSLRAGQSLGALAYGLAATALGLAGMTGILLSFGVAGANFTWEDPRKMNAGGLGCLGQLLSFAYIAVAFVCLAVPPALAAAFLSPPWYGYLAGLLLGSVTATAGVAIPLRLVWSKLKHLGE